MCVCVCGSLLNNASWYPNAWWRWRQVAAHRQPAAMLLENVANLHEHDGGNTLTTICKALDRAGYDVNLRVINARCLLPQQRERLFFACIRRPDRAPGTPEQAHGPRGAFVWPPLPQLRECKKRFGRRCPCRNPVLPRTLADILEPPTGRATVAAAARAVSSLQRLAPKLVHFAAAAVLLIHSLLQVGLAAGGHRQLSAHQWAKISTAVRGTRVYDLAGAQRGCQRHCHDLVWSLRRVPLGCEVDPMNTVLIGLSAV